MYLFFIVAIYFYFIVFFILYFLFLFDLIYTVSLYCNPGTAISFGINKVLILSYLILNQKHSEDTREIKEE